MCQAEEVRDRGLTFLGRAGEETLQRGCFGVNGDHHTVRKDSTSTTLLEPSLGTGN